MYLQGPLCLLFVLFFMGTQQVSISITTASVQVELVYRFGNQTRVENYLQSNNCVKIILGSRLFRISHVNLALS